MQICNVQSSNERCMFLWTVIAMFFISSCTESEKWKRVFLDCVMDRFVFGDNDVIAVFLISSCNSANGTNSCNNRIICTVS